MLSKCANPECDARFRYLRSGKLFQFDVAVAPDKEQSKAVSNIRPATKKPAHKVEHFWLCGECAKTLTLRHERIHGVVVVPLKHRRAIA